jgi:transposase
LIHSGTTKEAAVPHIWAGVDAGKEHHHCVVIDAEGRRLLSKRVLNDEAALTELIETVAALAEGERPTWACDLNRGGAALLIALLAERDQRLLYLSGLAVNRASGIYRGEAKTDARDAAVIADQARMRRDLRPVQFGDDLAARLRILTACRTDLVADRTRQINRLRALLVEIAPALERALDLTNRGPLHLLCRFQTPGAIRETGRDGVEAWLRERKVRGAARLAAAAHTAALKQHIAIPGEAAAAAIIARLAQALLDLGRDIDDIDDIENQTADLFAQHPQAQVITSVPGIGAQLGAEFIAATGGDMTAFGTADRLAGFAGLAPAPRDSGRVSGNLRRPRRYSRTLLRVFYLSALASLRNCAASKAFYQRKRREGKGHKQALLALARRRVNVLLALLRDNALYETRMPRLTAA